MKRLILLLSLFIFCSCSQSPQDINYGNDECYTCKMKIMDEKFGAEIITRKGKVYKFDDLICMIGFLKSDQLKESEINKKLVINYLEKNNFLDATQAVYFMGAEMRSPMNGQTGAFASKQQVVDFQNSKQGSMMDWNRVYDKLK